MTILLTGFDAFGGAEVNSSQLVIDALAQANHEDVLTVVLPTSYRNAAAQLKAMLRTHRPNRVLMLGLAHESKTIRLEQSAQNLNSCAAPDNDGEVRLSRSIAANAPVEYASSLPLKRMADIARRLGHEIEFSSDAGAFVCNHAFFTAAHAIAIDLPDSLCGFVHLPPIDGPGQELTRAVELIEAWIRDVLKLTACNSR